MAVKLTSSDPGFEQALPQLLAVRGSVSEKIGKVAASIVRDVRRRGDAALFEHTEKLDGCVIGADSIRIGPNEIDRAARIVPPDQQRALELAANRIRDYHRKQIPQDQMQRGADGSLLGWRWTAIESVGIYVPGGSASYPSSVLMNAIPAQVAGVKTVSMAVPTPDGTVNPLVLLAAKLAGVEQIFRIGGAQAIAAFAYGTESIAPVDKITGPGNAYVAAAKKLVFGDVGIDLVAGPSEVAVIADANAEPEWIAADLLAQAEHDPVAQSILLTDCVALADSVDKRVTDRLTRLPRQAIAAASWADCGAIITVSDMAEAVSLVNRIAPEHVQLCVSESGRLVAGIRNAGAIFCGIWTPEAIGDYVAGPNHILPTMGAARFASGLSVLDFMKRTTITELTPAGFAGIAPAAELLATAEGLEGHADSIRVRLAAIDGSGNG
ncbi:MAG: histidinol dehydrogenase [Rhodobacteraceae bacterium]|nr:histidinol dehydrogenase [Paracoccaceae bacterium]